MKSVDIELMLSMEEEGLRERLELNSWPEIKASGPVLDSRRDCRYRLVAHPA